MILAAGPLDVNSTAVLLLQPLFLLLSPMGGSAAAHPNQLSFPLLSICDSTVAYYPSLGRSSLGPRRRPPAFGALGMVWSTWSTTESHRKMTVRERLTVGMHHAPWMHACNGMWRAQCGQGTTSIGSVLYMERLTVGSTAAARKCLLITRKIMIPPPNSRDPPDGPPYFTKKMFPH